MNNIFGNLIEGMKQQLESDLKKLKSSMNPKELAELSKTQNELMSIVSDDSISSEDKLNKIREFQSNKMESFKK